MLLCCAGAPFLIMLDTNIVAVSLPSIARDLRGGFTDVEWVVSAYILPFAALLMPAGALADRLGRRRMLTIGLSIFTFASFLCGAAPNLATLNGARALQAVGAALQLTSSLAVVAQGFKPHERDRVYAIWGTVMGMAPPLGPILGGLVTSYLGWRWAFYINLTAGRRIDRPRPDVGRGISRPESVRLGLSGNHPLWRRSFQRRVGSDRCQ
jgi:MFS family permease